MFFWPKYGHVLHVWEIHQILLKRVSQLYTSWISRRNSADCEYQGDSCSVLSYPAGCSLVLLLFGQHELLLRAGYRDLMFARPCSEVFLFKAGKEKPLYFFAVLRRKTGKLFKATSRCRTHWLYLQACRGGRDHLGLPVMTVV